MEASPLNSEGISYPGFGNVPRSPLQGALMDKFNDWRTEGSKNIRPWMGEFLSRDQFNLPDSLATIQNRFKNNTSYFQANYVIIVLILLVLCV